MFLYIATSGSDYVGMTLDLVFNISSNVTVQCMNVTIINSPIVEEDETFTVSLTTLSSVVALGNKVMSVTITEDDSM